MTWLAILGISLANNLDNTGVGIAFGMARIRLSPLMNLWISLLTFAITALAVGFGDRLSSFLPLQWAHASSATLLCAMGLWMMLSSFHGPRKPTEPGSLSAGSPSLQQILADPTCADQNQSRDIDVREATLLAVALSLNNVGGGFGAGLLHLSALWTAFCSAAVSFLALWWGGWGGQRLSIIGVGKHAQVIAGALLVVIGLSQF